VARRGSRIARLARAVLKGMALVAAGFLVLSAVAVLALRFVPPATTTFILQARAQSLFDDVPGVLAVDRRWVPLDRISRQAAIAVVASEDQQFPFHRGFDFRQIEKALQDAQAGERVRGASTISQQVAKNLFLWNGRSWVRKGLEAWFTVLVEALWPKRRVLEMYLNVAEFGHGLYGVEAAAQRYFRKPAARLGAAEAALLAAVLPNPIRLRVDRPSRYVLGRQRTIQGQMRALGGPAYLAAILDTPAPRD
jgi:monofunctional glycosyltransferase